ncbi:hypothetical protein MNB_ARC-1_507 [hydrothermal vent metagenome]|uniref:Uncharacterized protein n=1 Tax=hydrothermal vent metagenome TaxID=652676 RepID=A0A3B1E6B6_9ZZZZ
MGVWNIGEYVTILAPYFCAWIISWKLWQLIITNKLFILASSIRSNWADVRCTPVAFSLIAKAIFEFIRIHLISKERQVSIKIDAN